MKITNVKVSDIKVYENNNKTHGDKQIKLLSETIQKYGFTNPIILNKDNVIIGGHGRLLSIKNLGWDEVPCVYVENLSKEDERKLRLLDNKIAELAEDNIENIKFELEELQDLELNELYDLEIEVIEDKEEVEDDVPEIQENIIVEKGDIFQLGEHRLMCGDSTSIDDVEKLMNGEKADMVFTDPPYGVKIKNSNGSILGDGNLYVFEGCLVCLKEFSKIDAHKYIYFGVQFLEESIVLCNNYFKQNNLIVNRITHENKPSPDGYFKSNYELCYFSNEGGKGFNKGFGEVSESTLNDSRYKGDGKMKTYPALLDGIKATEHNLKAIHPTQKTVAICEFYQNISSNKNDIVLDLFGGSGSTLIASEKTNRKCYMMELDEKYIQVILKRFYDYTEGKKEIKCLNREIDLDIILKDN